MIVHMLTITSCRARVPAVPHITIEYSANVADDHDIQSLVDVVHHAALDNGLAAPDALRTRAAARMHYRIADGQPSHAFIAICCRIGPGRDALTKTSFLEDILHAAETHIHDEGGTLAIAWSIELTEIDADYRINHNHVRARLAEQQEAM